MNNKIFYKLLVLAGFIIWFASTAYFGWKIKATSGVDLMFSTTGVIFIVWGILGDIANNLTIIKKNYETHNITTDKLNYHDERKKEGLAFDNLEGKKDA